MIDLYRFWDGQDRLLYVGISMHAAVRAMAHRSEKRYTWWPLVCRMDVEHLDTDSRGEALAIEELAIKTERPLYNGTHNPVRAPLPPPRSMEGPIHTVYCTGGKAYPLTREEWSVLAFHSGGAPCECGYTTVSTTHINRHRATRGHWPGAESTVYLPGRDNSGIWPRPNMRFPLRADPSTLVEHDPTAFNW